VIFVDIIKEHCGNNIFIVEGLTSNQNILKVVNLSTQKAAELKTDLMSNAHIKSGIMLSSVCRYLIQIYEFFVDGEYFYLIMDFCKNGDLQHILNEKKKFGENV
jgi:serine/threonine protein kinase